MRITTRQLVALCMGLGVAGTVGVATAQDGPPIPKPTEEHKLLAKDEGTWDATVKSWMSGPDSAPTISKGVEVDKLMPGGLWLLNDFDGEFGGMAFHGHGVTGYDTQKKKYIGTWVDSMTTSIMTMEGDYDADKHIMTMYGKGIDPAGKAYESKSVSKFEGDSVRVFTMSIKSDETKGEFMKMMEITYKRRSK
jgi:hypothetical protein